MAPREVTFLMTDIERSTALVQGLADGYCDVLAVHRDILVAETERRGGRVVEARADDFFAIFESAASAVEAARDAQRALVARTWPAGGEVRVRMGLHTGNALDAREGLVGLDVNLAARISDAGHGGQVLLSEQTVARADATARDIGRYELAGLPEPTRIFQLLDPALPWEFPPLRRARFVPEEALRVVLADDAVLVRQGIAHLLDGVGVTVVGEAGTPEELLTAVAEMQPDVAIVDIRMPPTGTDEGLRAGKTIRREFPGTGVLLLSQALEPVYARELAEDGAGGVGYLLKDRVSCVDAFADAIRRVAAGETVLDEGLGLAV
jgi:class 3 adenylate cyclase/CheY-like chemotaxis protein